MATNAQGVKRKVVFSKETAYGTKPTATTGKILTRTEISLNTNFESFSSEEIRSDLQRSPTVVGFEKVEGDIKGELACGQWSAFLAAALRGTWSSEAKKPIVNKTSGGSGEKNGKILAVPETAHATDSFCIEDFFQDINVSRVYLGCRVSKISIDVQPNGIASITTSFLGQRGEEQSTAYFTSPTPQVQSEKLAGVNGRLMFNKESAALVTSFKLDIDLNASSEPVLGAKYAPDVFIGTVKVDGSFTFYFQDKKMIDAVRSGNNLSLALRLDAGSANNSDYINIVLPGIKATSVDIDDGEKLLMQTCNFSAFPAVYDASSQVDDLLKKPTTIIIQDTLA
ncbi:phage tail tube protein [Pasteurella sp. PK-2025]|uniref:phage tail tube protein n=1 Tax=Pasteurella sp. PK-2025 TaxID=3413133 RepID=UPI003C779678